MTCRGSNGTGGCGNRCRGLAIRTGCPRIGDPILHTQGRDGLKVFLCDRDVVGDIADLDRSIANRKTLKGDRGLPSGGLCFLRIEIQVGAVSDCAEASAVQREIGSSSNRFA